MSSSVSKVRIGNLALGHIGTDNTIENFDEKSAEAKQIDLWYEFAREMALAEFDWGFARKRLAMATHSEDPPDGVWAYRYQYPADCIRARSIEAGPSEVPPAFEIETAGSDNSKSILTNRSSDSVLVYTRDVNDTTLFTPHFVIALSYLLAHFIAYALTRKKKVKEDMMDAYQGMVTLAAAHSLSENMPDEPPDASSIQARNGGSSSLRWRRW